MNGLADVSGKRLARELATVILLSAILMAVFYNRFWYAPDEGNYAHVAERLLAGETLHRTIQDVHAGYINFINAGAFALFGIRLVSLRYPLAILAVAQSGLMFLMLRPRGLFPAAVGALAFTCLGFVQFLNPTANWYCLFLAVVTACWIRWAPVRTWRRGIGTGILIGMTFFFRQLSGVLLALGVVTFMLLDGPASRLSRPPRLAHTIILLMGVGLTVYLAAATDGVGWLLVGMWPYPVLLHAWRRTAVPDRELGMALLSICVGAVIAGLPLLAYHVTHRSVFAWWADSAGAAASLSRLGFMDWPGYSWVGVLALRGLLTGDLVARLNGAFWLGLLLLTAILGVTLIRFLVRRPAGSDLHPLPIIAVFYAVVSLHSQVPIYIYYAAGLTLTALLWLAAAPGNPSRLPVVCLSAALALIGVCYQAAMPLSRGLEGIVAGRRYATGTRLDLPRAGLYVDAKEAARYQQIIGLIDRETAPGDSIFALPSNAELYFLAERTNPFRFYNSALGIRSSAELDSTLHILRCWPPKLVLYDSTDKYNTAASAQLAGFVRARYELLTPFPPFQVFRRRAGPSPEGGADADCHASE